MLKWMFISLGTISVMGGMVTFWLPLPLGLPLFLIGIALLMKSSPDVRNRILQLASGHPKIAKFVKRIGKTDRLGEEGAREKSE
jgi:uncharacterized membrane protein YbaN (DUF454 family)